MWGQTWENIGDFARPFPNKPALNVTPALIEQVRFLKVLLLLYIVLLYIIVIITFPLINAITTYSSLLFPTGLHTCQDFPTC